MGIKLRNPFERVNETMMLRPSDCERYGIGRHAIGHILIEVVRTPQDQRIYGVSHIPHHVFKRRYNWFTYHLYYRFFPDYPVSQWRRLGLL